MRSRRMMALCLGLLALAGSSRAQTDANRITREQSSLLLDMPGLSEGQELFRYFGWDAQFSAERTFAAQLPARGQYPQAQVLYTRLAAGWYWRYTVLDEAWVRQFSFFKERALENTKGLAGPTSDYLSTIRFRVDGSDCVGFSMRSVAMGVEGAQSSGTPSFEGLYCGPIGQALSEDGVRAAIGGVYFRERGQIRRAFAGDGRPIPERLARGN